MKNTCRDKENELIWIDHQNGKLGYYINDHKEAVLCDYIGDASILLLPYILGDENNYTYVSSIIPDEAFQSCENVSLVVVDSRFDNWNLGMFLFEKCDKLIGLVDLYAYYYDEDYGLNVHHAGITYDDEISFVNSNYTTKNIKKLNMAFSRKDFDSGLVYKFIKLLSEQHLEEHLGDLLKTIQQYNSLTGEVLDACDNTVVSKCAKQFGCNMSALSFLGDIWKECKETTI